MEIHQGGHNNGWLLLLWLVINALLLGLVLLGVLFVAKQFIFRRRRHWAGPPGGFRTPALDELEMRYARGDLARDDYLARRSDLMASAPMHWGPPPGWGPPPPPHGGPPPPPTAPAAAPSTPAEPPPA